jgi:hypothetical protein
MAGLGALIGVDIPGSSGGAPAQSPMSDATPDFSGRARPNVLYSGRGFGEIVTAE